MRCFGIFITGSNTNYHFPARSLLPTRSESETKIHKVLELRSPRGKLELRNVIFGHENQPDTAAKAATRERLLVWLHVKFVKMNMTKPLR